MNFFFLKIKLFFQSLYNKAQKYMPAIAGQTVGPNLLNFFEGIHGYPRVGMATPAISI